MSEEIDLLSVLFSYFINYNFSKNKLGDKRKRSEDFSAEEHEQSKKAKLSEDDEDSPATPESVGILLFSFNILTV